MTSLSFSLPQFMNCKLQDQTDKGYGQSVLVFLPSASLCQTTQNNDELLCSRSSGIYIRFTGASRRKRHRFGLFSNVFFSQLCNCYTSLKGLQSLKLSGMKPLKAFYIFPQREEVRLLHFFGCKIDYLYPPIFFINVNNVLYLYFASFKQLRLFKYTGFVEVIIESDRGSKALAGQKQTLRQVSGRGQTE